VAESREVDVAQHLNLKASIGFSAVSALFVVSASTALIAQAEARAPRVYPAISLDTVLARDADTFEADRTIEAACRKSGQNKHVCLCVTHIMKYELTLAEHRAATRLYGQPANRTALHDVLKNEGVSPAQINLVEDMERSLTKDKDFALRCSEAKAYYKEAAE